MDVIYICTVITHILPLDVGISRWVEEPRKISYRSVDEGMWACGLCEACAFNWCQLRHDFKSFADTEKWSLNVFCNWTLVQSWRQQFHLGVGNVCNVQVCIGFWLWKYWAFLFVYYREIWHFLAWFFGDEFHYLFGRWANFMNCFTWTPLLVWRNWDWFIWRWVKRFIFILLHPRFYYCHHGDRPVTCCLLLQPWLWMM